MRTNTALAQVEVEGFGESQDFIIVANAKLFQQLSTGIYSDPVAAVIREYCCNALDAHVAAGREGVPFRVDLPSSVDPTFRVRDFGTGMSHEFVMRHFSSYGLSTKEDTDAQIGCLGLGSKSAYSLAEHFIVTVWQSGERRDYVCYRKPNGTPAIDFAGAQPSDEPDGTQIEFAAASWSIDKFQEKAESILQWFPEGSHDLPVQRPKALFEGDGFTIFTSDSEYVRPSVIMGNVRYPIDFDNVIEPIAGLRSVPFVIWAPMGAVSFSTSREEMNYDKPTTDFINRALQDMVASVDEYVGDILRSITSPGAFHEALEQLTSYYGAANGDLSPFKGIYKNRGGWVVSQYNGYVPERVVGRSLAFSPGFINPHGADLVLITNGGDVLTTNTKRIAKYHRVKYVVGSGNSKLRRKEIKFVRDHVASGTFGTAVYVANPRDVREYLGGAVDELVRIDQLGPPTVEWKSRVASDPEEEVYFAYDHSFTGQRSAKAPMSLVKVSKAEKSFRPTRKVLYCLAKRGAPLIGVEKMAAYCRHVVDQEAVVIGLREWQLKKWRARGEVIELVDEHVAKIESEFSTDEIAAARSAQIVRNASVMKQLEIFASDQRAREIIEELDSASVLPADVDAGEFAFFCQTTAGFPATYSHLLAEVEGIIERLRQDDNVDWLLRVSRYNPEAHAVLRELLELRSKVQSTN